MSNEILSVRQLVENTVSKHGTKVFCRYIRDGEVREKTYNEFYEDCLAVCRYIRSVDDCRRHHIAFIGKTNYEYIACLTGMIFSGSVVCPFAPDITVEEALKLFDDADIEMLFCEEEFSGNAYEIKEKYKGLSQIVSLGNSRWFENVFRKYNSDSEYAHLSDVYADPDECALIVYTSGTTGDRKGVMLSNHNIAANTCYDEFTAESDNVEFSILPMHHVFCYCCDVLKTVYDGGTICINGALANMYKNFLIYEPTIMRIVPAICKSILTRLKITAKNNPELTPRQVADKVVGRNMYHMISGSAFLSGAVIDEFEKFGITVRQGYGMSEVSPRISTVDFSETCKYSNGKVLSVNDVRSVDGEIQVKGPSVMIGYYKRPEETKEAFTEDGYFRTGDLGYLQGDHIYLTGRKKNLLILSNGENISPETIENRFLDEELVKEIVCYVKDDSIEAEIFPDKDLAAAHGIEDIESAIKEVVQKINEKSPSSQQITSFTLRDTPFIRTSTGKIKRTVFYFGNKN